MTDGHKGTASAMHKELVTAKITDFVQQDSWDRREHISNSCRQLAALYLLEGKDEGCIACLF